MAISLFADAVSLLTLTHSASVNVVRGTLSALDLLYLTDQVEVNHKIVTAESILPIEDLFSSNSIVPGVGVNLLSLTQVATSIKTGATSANNLLNFVGEVECTLYTEAVFSQLDLQQGVYEQKPILVSAENNLTNDWYSLDPSELLGVEIADVEAVVALFDDIGLNQNVAVKVTLNLSLISYLSPAQQAALTLEGLASNHLHLSQSSRVVFHEEVLQILDLSQDVIDNIVIPVDHILDLSHSANSDAIRERNASNSLNLRSVVTYITIDFCNYTPGIGEGSFDYPPPSPIEPTLTRRPTTVLTWPYSSPTLTIELRNPDFDNIEQYEFRRINRRTRGGTLDLYRDEDWPKTKRLICTFQIFSAQQRQFLFKFLERSIGQEIGILDFESRQWRGVILTPSTAIDKPKRFGFSTSLEFEGELVP